MGPVLQCRGGAQWPLRNAVRQGCFCTPDSVLDYDVALYSRNGKNPRKVGTGIDMEKKPPDYEGWRN